MDGLILLDTVGSLRLYLEQASRDILIAFETELGVVTASLTAERATQLGISLIRESGKRYVFKRAEQPRKERPNETVPNSPDGGAATDDPVPISPDSNGVPRRERQDFGPSFAEVQQLKDEQVRQYQEGRRAIEGRTEGNGAPGPVSGGGAPQEGSRSR